MATISLPAGCVTGVGSLPFTDAVAAVDFVAQHCPQLPFWPQLPRRCTKEAMITQVLGALSQYLEPAGQPFCWSIPEAHEATFAKALRDDTAALVPETAGGFFEFERRLRANHFANAAGIKAQFVGPLTLAHCLFSHGKSLAGQPGWLELITGYISRQAVWQIQRLQQGRQPIVLVVDEPIVGHFPGSGTPSGGSGQQSNAFVEAIECVLQSIRNAGAIAGLHCCAPLPIPIIEHLSIDYLSFDAHLVQDVGGLVRLSRQILDRGGLLAFGLIPTTLVPVLNDVPALTSQWGDLASNINDVRNVARRTLVTATCGIGSGTLEHAKQSFQIAAEVGNSIRTQSGLTSI
jgi:hypothetical protein